MFPCCIGLLVVSYLCIALNSMDAQRRCRKVCCRHTTVSFTASVFSLYSVLSLVTSSCGQESWSTPASFLLLHLWLPAFSGPGRQVPKLPGIVSNLPLNKPRRCVHDLQTTGL